MKRRTVDWEKILSNHKSDKGLISRKYKELSELNSWRKEKSNEQFEWERNLNWHITAEEI